MTNLETIAARVIEGRAADVAGLVREALEQGVDAGTVLDQGLIAGMAVVGARFRANEIFVPEVLVAARAMKAGLELLEPVFSASGVEPVGTVVLGTVKGDIHDIGKNLVASMLQAGGFEVFDLGADVKIERFIDKAEEVGAGMICLSALLTTTMMNQRRLIALLRDRGLRDKYKVLVGGAPASRKWAEEIGADGYAENAVAAVKLAKSLAGRP